MRDVTLDVRGMYSKRGALILEKVMAELASSTTIEGNSSKMVLSTREKTLRIMGT